MTQDDSSALVFFLLDEPPPHDDQVTSCHAVELPELLIDDHTPRFVCRHVTAQWFDVEEALVLKVCGATPFLSTVWSGAAAKARGAVRRELSLLRAWIKQSPQQTIAYQWALGTDGLHAWRKPDDLVTYWEEMNAEAQAQMRLACASFICDWFDSRDPLPLAMEPALFSEMLYATAENLPFYEYALRSLATGERTLAHAPDQVDYRICDWVAKMFVRFPTYMSRRFLRRDRDVEGELRAKYLHLLATAFQYRVAPVSLDRFCDYLSVRADCHGQERADLAWFVGELSLVGRPRVFLGAGAPNQSDPVQGVSLL